MPESTSLTRSAVLVRGCRPPVNRGRPGRVTSMVSSARRRASSASSSSARRAAMRALRASAASLMRAPKAGRSSGGSVPMVRRSALRLPLRPRYCASTAARSAVLEAAWTAASASCVIWAIGSVTIQSSKQAKTPHFESLLPLRERGRWGVWNKRWIGNRFGTALGSRRLSRRGQRARRLRDELRKRLGIADSHLRQHLAIQGYAGFGQSLDEAAVLHALGAAGRADTYDPQAAKLALFVAAVPVSIVTGLHPLLVGRFVQVTLGTPVTLRLLQDLQVALMRHRATFDARHRERAFLIQ